MMARKTVGQNWPEKRKLLACLFWRFFRQTNWAWLWGAKM
jgi:hypothetical protein